MASISTKPAAASGKRKERVFFSLYIVLIALLIVYGFAPSFYLRGTVAPRGPLPTLRVDMIVHGVIATAFLLAMPLQALLVAAGRQKLHMQLGNWFIPLGAAMIATLYVVTAYSHHAFPGDAAPVSFFSVATLVASALLLWLAWRKRFDGQAHKRYIVALACIMAGPGLARTGFFPPPPAGIVVTNLGIVSLLVPLWIWDLAKLRRIHRATLTGSTIVAGFLAFGVLAGATPLAGAVVAVLPGMGWP